MKPNQSIKAIQYRAYGGYAENRLVDLPTPAANDGQILVRMRTVGINPLDNTFRSGHHYAATPENLPRVGGQMGAGVVVETKSPSFKVGDGVMRLSGGKGVDVIVDGVGGKLTGEALGCLLPGGTYAVVGYAGGREASVNLTDIIWKAAKVLGFTFRGFAPETLAAAQKTLIGYLSDGTLNGSTTGKLKEKSKWQRRKEGISSSGSRAA
jgi:NADPH:quinone reductase-like Zn-dependent oxidoreductase